MSLESLIDVYETLESSRLSYRVSTKSVSGLLWKLQSMIELGPFDNVG